MPNDDNIPNYLKDIPNQNFGNLTSEDAMWVGENGELDSEKLIKDYGHDLGTPLQWLLKALILGHLQGTKKLDEVEVAQKLKDATKAIVGKLALGNSKKDDNEALLEIANRYFIEWYEAPRERRNNIKLRPIVRSVVNDSFSNVPNERNIKLFSYIEKLEDKFNENKDKFLIRATLDNSWGRFDDIEKFEKLVQALNQFGIPANSTFLKPLRLRKNKANPKKDET